MVLNQWFPTGSPLWDVRNTKCYNMPLNYRLISPSRGATNYLKTKLVCRKKQKVRKQWSNANFIFYLQTWSSNSFQFCSILFEILEENSVKTMLGWLHTHKYQIGFFTKTYMHVIFALLQSLAGLLQEPKLLLSCSIWYFDLETCIKIRNVFGPA